MRTLVTGVCALAMSFTGVSLAQDKNTAATSSTETQQTTKAMTGTTTTKTTNEVVRGKVHGYTPGKSISVTVPGTIIKTKSFSLNSKNETVRLTSNIRKGDWVTVRESTGNNGHRTVTVSHTSAKSTKATS
jgi:hypothetical protein